MSNLGELYKQAHTLVLKEYETNPEDAWKVNAIYRARLGQKGHESVMFQFVRDVEKKVDELVAKAPITTDTLLVVDELPTVAPTKPH
jgi:hypothetical protein